MFAWNQNLQTASGRDNTKQNKQKCFIFLVGLRQSKSLFFQALFYFMETQCKDSVFSSWNRLNKTLTL